MHVSMMITQQERSARSRPLQRVRAGTETRWVSLVRSEDKDFKGVRAPSKEVRAPWAAGCWYVQGGHRRRGARGRRQRHAAVRVAPH